jgi:Divergent InlB B-repeat domain
MNSELTSCSDSCVAVLSGHSNDPQFNINLTCDSGWSVAGPCVGLMGKAATACTALLLLAPLAPLRAQLGLPHEAYGVWDRGGYSTFAEYPVARGQAYANTWQNVNPARHTFDWTSLDAQLQFADSQNENFIIQILPVGGGSNGVPPWILAANGGGVPQYTDGIYTFGDYLNFNYKQYYTEMVQALAYHLRQDPALSAKLRARIAFVRVDTGTTGDEVPYQNDAYVKTNFPQYYVDKAGSDWLTFRLWAFEVYRAAFQDGAGPVVPMLYQAVDKISNVTEWNWVVANVKGGFGVKFGGNGRGHQLTNSDDVPGAFKSFTVNPTGMQLFSRNEMDNTFQQPYFQLNVRLGMYWAAVEQLNAGMSVWDVNTSCLQDSLVHNYTSAFQFFNQWAAEVIPATAGGGFCILHEGLDSSDTVKFPVASYGLASQANIQRYTAICNAYAAQGAKMDDLNGATLGALAQRGNNPGLTGFNDAGWNIVPGNYERFITQINPDTTSKGIWRVNGPLTSTSNPYDRFARRSDHASGKDTMYFDINDKLLPTPGQQVQINVTYFDRGTGKFKLLYDAAKNSQKLALTVTKTNTNTWLTKSVVLTDWAFGNHGPNGADLQLVNLDTVTPNTIFHSIEVIKLATIKVGIVGQGTVTGRNNAVAYSALPSSVMEGQRLELTATPAAGYVFTGWSGALTGTNPHPYLFPTRTTNLTATFALASVSESVDDFNSGTWSGGSGWTGDWVTTGSPSSGLLSAQLSAGQSITRTLTTPLTGATLSFDWDLDRISTSEAGTVQVFNGTSWTTVWTRNIAGSDDSSNPNLVTSGSINLSTISGAITQIRFTLNATGGGNFYLDNVVLRGTPHVGP